MTETTRQGIEALKNGDRSRARQLLRQAVEENPDSVKAWLWLSGAVDTDRERVLCLRRVLELDPANAAARRGLTKLSSEATTSRPTERSAAQPRETEKETVNRASTPPSSAAADRRTRRDSRRASHKSESKSELTVRPSLVPVFIVSFLALLLFAALFAFVRSATASDPVAATITIFTLFVMLAVLGVRIFLILLRRLFTRYTLTSDHLIVQRGILSRSRKTIPVQRIQDVATKQSLIERPFGIGDVVVESAGERGAAALDDLPMCEEYAKRILQAVNEQNKGTNSFNPSR